MNAFASSVRVALAGCTALAIGAAHGQIRTDGSLGPATSLSGPNFLINQALGKLSGNNLFQSFAVFNIGSGESATFVTTTPGLANVISRVTGGSASTINGLLRLSATGATPDFYFINPAGVIFGNGAQIDVPAAFNVSTASYLKFPDGNFYADLNATSTLSAAAPEAFGFLGNARATIAINDARLIATTGAPEQAIRVVAGDISVDNGGVLTGRGEIRVAAVGADATVVPLAGPLGNAQGHLTIANGGFIASITDSNEAAGNILVTTGDLSIRGLPDGSSFTGISSQSLGTGGGAGNVSVRATGGMVLNDFGTISSESFASDASGTVSIVADSLTLLRGGAIGTANYGNGNAAAVSVLARDLTIDGQSNTVARTGILSVNRDGDAGNVDVTVERMLSLVNGGEISADTQGAGRAGNVTIRAGAMQIDGRGFTGFTGIASDVFSGSGDGGDVDVNVAGALTIAGGAIAARTASSGDAGSLRIAASTLALFDGGSIDAGSFGAGRAGSIDVTATTLSLASGGAISSNAVSTGNAGSVAVSARDLSIVGDDGAHFTGISSLAKASSTGDAGDVKVEVGGTLSIARWGTINSNTSSSGHAGTVEVNADTISIATSGMISSFTNDAGNAGSVKVSARNLSIDGKDGEFNTGINSLSVIGATGNAGDVSVKVSDTLTIDNQGTINSDTFSSGNAGKVTINADRIVMRTGAQISTSTFGEGDGGSIAVDARLLTLEGDGALLITRIGSEAKFSATGRAGDVAIDVSDTLTVANGGSISSSTFSNGLGGKVDVRTDTLVMTNGGLIDSSAYSTGDAGSVHVVARNALLDGGGDGSFTRISSDASVFANGNAGNVRVDVADTLTLLRGGIISSDTINQGNAGSVSVEARNIVIDGGIDRWPTGISSEVGPFSTKGNGGDVSVIAHDTLTLANFGLISSDTFTAGNAGRVAVSAGTLTIGSGAQISSSTYGSGAGGRVSVAADDLTIDGSADRFTGITGRSLARGTGAAGDVTVDVAGTLGIGNGGGISTQTASPGKGGTVNVAAGTLAMTTDGVIVSGTSSSGTAGSVTVSADAISLSSHAIIGAAADAGSSGQTGTVTVNARDALTLAGGAEISITNGATVANPSLLTPTLLSVSAPTITIDSGAQITAASFGNVAASNVAVDFGPQLFLQDAAIATSASAGDGGDLTVRGSGTLLLQNGQITTSVLGAKGNGGDIRIAAPILVMQTGFIQANTAAAAATGGNVIVDAGTLLPSGSTLFVGGSTPLEFQSGVFGFNVIQAAAPTGVSGDIRISTPALDITGSIASLPAKYLDAGGPGRSPCSIVGGSSLSYVGRGGTLPRLNGLLWIDAIDGPQTLGAIDPSPPSSPARGSLRDVPCNPWSS